MLTHIYPTGQTFVQHVGGVDCRCNPTTQSKVKAQVVGRGRKQGYATSKVVVHNMI